MRKILFTVAIPIVAGLILTPVYLGRVAERTLGERLANMPLGGYGRGIQLPARVVSIHGAIAVVRNAGRGRSAGPVAGFTDP